LGVSTLTGRRNKRSDSKPLVFGTAGNALKKIYFKKKDDQGNRHVWKKFAHWIKPGGRSCRKKRLSATIRNRQAKKGGGRGRFEEHQHHPKAWSPSRRILTWRQYWGEGPECSALGFSRD